MRDPKLDPLPTDGMRLAREAEQDNRYRNYRWMYFLGFSALLGGKLAGATAKLASFNERSVSETRRVLRLFGRGANLLWGALCRGAAALGVCKAVLRSVGPEVSAAGVLMASSRLFWTGQFGRMERWGIPPRRLYRLARCRAAKIAPSSPVALATAVPPKYACIAAYKIVARTGRTASAG
jgi:hypothetical protein